MSVDVVRRDVNEDADSKRKTAEAFGAAASDYHESEVHREGEDLELLASWCADAERALDVATGGGHTAGALRDAGVPEVVAVDAAPEMVATATDAYGVAGVVGDAERIPFATGSVDAVACRIAAHHFPAPEDFLDEVARVLVPGGVFAFEDNVAPASDELAEYVNRIERIRDPTHVESCSVGRWVECVEAAGLRVRDVERVTHRLDFANWCDRTSVGASDRETLAAMLRDPPEGGETVLDVRTSGGPVESFCTHSGLFRAVA